VIYLSEVDTIIVDVGGRFVHVVISGGKGSMVFSGRSQYVGIP
jgi:hypothetical protein